MTVAGWPSTDVTRRRFFLSLPAASAAASLCKGASARNSALTLAPSKYDDLATDLAVTRLTDPAYSTYLPPPAVKSIARRGGFLVFAADVSGRREVYRLDVKKAEAVQATEAESLGPFAMLPDERGVLYADGGALMSASFGNARPRQVYRGARITALNVSIDGLYAAVVEEGSRLVLVNLRTGAASALAEGEDLADPAPRPKRASVLYRRGGEVWLANYDGKQNYRLRLGTEASEVSASMWSPDARAVLYLNVPGPGKLNTIREFVPDTNQDAHIANTTQFRSFDRNSDATMFVGASVSAASPYVLLLSRAVERELPLCEHRSASTPVFSPDSQQIFFTSELHGKPALYQMDVRKFVEETNQA